MKIAKYRLRKERGWRVDFLLLFSVLALVVFGCVMVFSASYYSAELTYNSKYFFLKKQVIGALIGLAAMVFFYFFSYEKLKRFKWIAIGLSLLLLALVFIPHVGVKVYGAKRWINLGFFTLQPSEIAKFGFVIFAAASLSKAKNEVKSFKGILPTLLMGALMCLLIILEPNMSITICVGVTMISMLFVGGAKFKHFALLAVPILALGVLLVVLAPYRLKRLIAFIDPFASATGEGFQLVQSLYGLANGGLFGVGLFNSRQKYLFLPFAESDFIFSIIAEELGFLGCVILLLVFLVVIVRGIIISMKAPTRFGCYLASGITTIIAVQTIMNVAVVTGSIPPTGLPLPFISAGSTSIVVFMAAVGVLLNIDKQSHLASIGKIKIVEENILSSFNLFHKKERLTIKYNRTSK